MRVHFYQVEIGLDKIYGNFAETDQVEIEAVCEMAREFVEACGWTVESYLSRMWGFDSKACD